MGEESSGKYWVGFDLGGTKMQATVLDEKFKARGSARKKTKAHEGASRCMERMVGVIEEALEQAGAGKKDVAGVGMGVPGPLDLDKGELLEAANLGWKNVPLRHDLEKALGCPAVILNDVDAGVYGEYRLGAAKHARCVLGVFPGTGIGGGCVYEGKIFRGKNSSCFEIGHCQVQPEGPLCGCGRRGCLEAVASRLAISAAAAVAAFRGDAPHLREECGTDLSNIRSQALASSIQAGDKAVEEIVRAAAQWLGVAIATTVHLVAPDVVVLGGGLVEAMPELYRLEVEESAKENVMKSFRGSFKVVVAELGDDATAMGAAAWASEVTAGSGR